MKQVKGVALTLEKTALERPNIKDECSTLARLAMTIHGVPESSPLQLYKEIAEVGLEYWNYLCEWDDGEPEPEPEVEEQETEKKEEQSA